MSLNLRTGFAGILILAVGLAIYWPILAGSGGGLLYPWASDTMGHLLKAEFIASELQEGRLYPQLFPQWYSGVQLLRYFPPFPYYLLAGIFLICRDIVLTAGFFISATALVGGLSMLMYQRWIGLLPATVGGVLFMALPDNLRVAMAEGNLPRILANAWLPVTFYFLLSILINGPSKRRFVLLAGLTMLIVLSHPMMGAIFLACFALTAIAFLIFGDSPPRNIGIALASMFTGVLLSAWWLLPSLTGGITELDTVAAGEALASFSPTFSLNPFLRLENKEAYYLGLSLLAGVVLALLNWKRLDPQNRGLVFVALVVLAVSSTIFNPIYRSLPFHELMWPIRFMTFAGFILLIAVLWWSRQLLEGSMKSKLAALVIVVALIADAWPSQSLIFVRPASGELAAVVQSVRELPGWRVATLDASRLGSRASYLFSSVGDREQVYGWAYQGSQIAPLLASVNYALTKGYTDYAVDRLGKMGTDYVVLLKDAPIDPSLDHVLKQRRYRVVEESKNLVLYHRAGEPRAFVPQFVVLGIGEGTRYLAMLFPEILVASSPRIDDYNLEDLQRFRTLVLAGFSWKNKRNAEELIRAYVEGGGNAIVDLTGVPEDTLSRWSKFLGVYGEPLSLDQPPILLKDGAGLTLRPFDQAYAPWSTFTPQGLAASTVTLSYLTQEATAVGYINIEGGRVWFLGMNLAFHTLLTHDPVGVSLLEEVLRLDAGAVPMRETVPMRNYTAGSEGYSFDLTLDGESVLMIPVARHDGTTVTVDDRRVDPKSFGDMTYIDVPKGRHTVGLGFEPTGVYRLGYAGTAVAALIIVGIVTGLPGSLRRIRSPSMTPRSLISWKSWVGILRTLRRREPFAGGDSK